MHPRIEELDVVSSTDSIWWEDYKPLNIVMNAKISFTWKYLGRGGAAKVKKYFCHYCTLKSDNIVIPNEEQCSKWCDPESNVPCFHQTFADNTNMEEYKRMHEQLSTILAQ